MAQDLQGLPVTGSAASVAALDRAIRDYYAWTGDILGDLSAATRADPGFVLGHSVVATVLRMSGFRGDHPAVAEAIVAAEAAAKGATARERAHVALAKAMADGALRGAARIAESILGNHPTDALALRYATDLYYYLGDAAAIREVVARVLPAWPDSDPIFGFILGRLAFGLEESGEYEPAESVGRRALAINPADAWATHAVAHVYEMTGQTDTGIRFLEETRDDWHRGQWLAVHLGWHLSLFLIDADRGNEVLDRYDRFARPRLKDNFIMDLIDGASMLWRLELAGVAVGDRWQELAALGAGRIGEHVLAFNDLHAALAIVGADDHGAAARLLDSLDRYLAAGRGDNRAISAEIGRPLIVAMTAFGNGDDRRAIELLRPLRGKLVRIGGSHAQRDVADETLIAAALRASDWPLARALLAERLSRRPTARLNRLYAHAKAASPC